MTIDILLLRLFAIFVAGCVLYGVVTDIVAFDHDSQIIRAVRYGVPIKLNRDYVRCFSVQPESISDKMKVYIMGQGHVVYDEPYAIKYMEHRVPPFGGQ